MLVILKCWVWHHKLALNTISFQKKSPLHYYATISILSFSVNLKHFYPMDALQAFTVTWMLLCWYRAGLFQTAEKLLETSVPSDMQQRAKGLVAFHVSKAYSPASAYGNCCGIISKGVWSQSALTLQWFGGGEEMSKQFMCPHCEEEGSQGKFPVMESKFTQVVYCNFKALVFCLPLLTPLHLYNNFCDFAD